MTGTKEAQATVVVLQSFLPGPGEFVTPRIGFDSVDESEELAEGVARRLDDGTDPDDLHISVDIVSNLNRPNPSLLYGVKAEDKNTDRAIKIANLAVEEAREIFEEINTPSPRDVRAAYSAELDGADADVESARAELVAFEQTNNAYGLSDRIDHQLALVSQMRVSLVSADAGLASAGGSDDPASLQAARAERDRLLSLQSEYNRLVFELGLAQSAIARLEQRESDLTLAGDDGAGAVAEVRDQLATQRQRLVSAQGGLSAFETANSASQLPSAIQTQQALVSQLTISQAGGHAGADSYGAALEREQNELNRLLSLQPEHDKLNLELTKAEGRLATLEQRIVDIEAGRSLPIQADVNVLHEASIQSNLWWKMITYALAVILALFISLTGIYLLGYFQPQAPTVGELEGAFARPVLARIPKAPR
ncbi:MAG: hypothetical protein Q7T33_03130 [Dehalococcoidia bacterium]|nr:hypothetical protein [Dehalococcoidia bacterium]